MSKKKFIELIKDSALTFSDDLRDYKLKTFLDDLENSTLADFELEMNGIEINEEERNN